MKVSFKTTLIIAILISIILTSFAWFTINDYGMEKIPIDKGVSSEDLLQQSMERNMGGKVKFEIKDPNETNSTNSTDNLNNSEQLNNITNNTE